MDPRRALPSVEAVAHELVGLPHPLLVDCAREAVDRARAHAATGEAIDAASVIADAAALVATRQEAVLRPLVNATGVLLHTNLGRAPIGAQALADAAVIATSYSNLEYRVRDGSRGSRHEHAGALLARACGAEAGIVVNNNAAAVILTLAALGRGRDVVVSRGELVEIGGGFRVPEIMAESGCRLVEVGTTNRTRRRDYHDALTADTALVLKVHASNYRMVGFVETTSIAELASLDVPVMVDAGSGLLDDTTPWLSEPPAWLHDEPGVRQAVDAGAALVTFSGDKLLGGPQAGIIVGRAEAVATVARHPLARAMRADKVTLALLQTVATAYLDGDTSSIPFWRMATITVDDLRDRAEHITRAAPGTEVVDTEAAAGGGSLPGLTIPSVGIALDGGARSAAQLTARLRAHDVIARIVADRAVCDLRTVDPVDDAVLIAAVRAVTAG
ncbi:MAG: L-seryl-tRNA(Sec) selenium transferase [Acidimicrobiia bacterium]